MPSALKALPTVVQPRPTYENRERPNSENRERGSTGRVSEKCHRLGGVTVNSGFKTKNGYKNKNGNASGIFFRDMSRMT